MPTKSLAAEVREILQQEGPSTCDEILAHSELAQSRTQLANNLYQMSLKGALRKEREGKQVLYRLPTETEQKASAIERDRKASRSATKKKAAARPAPEPTDLVQAHLEENLRRTQEALDAYIKSVVEPEVYEALCGARDHAREAFHACIAEDAS